MVYSVASGAQVVNFFYTVLGVFKVNDKLLAEYEKVKAGKETAGIGKVGLWVQEWKGMDRVRMLLMWATAAAGVFALWRN